MKKYRPLSCPDLRTGRRRALAGLTAGAFAVFAASGCSSDDEDVGPDAGPEPDADVPDVTYEVGGEVTGLEESSVTLLLNDEESLTLAEDGEFAFDTELEDGASYEVSIQDHPDEGACELQNATGAISGADVDDVLVNCTGLSLGAVNEEEAVALEWDYEGEVEILHSTDPNCDFRDVQNCENGGGRAELTGGEATLTIEDDDLLPSRLYHFVLRAEGQISPPATATAAPFQLSGSVRDVVIGEDRVFAGGAFDSYASPATGLASFRADREDAAQTGGFVELARDASGQLIPSGTITDMIEDPTGDGYFIAGSFAVVNGEERQNIARIRGDLTVDPDWEVDIEAANFDLETDGDRLFIAGNYDSLNGDGDFQRLAAVFLDSADIDANFTPDPDGEVRQIDVDGDRLVAGGLFENIGGEERPGLAALDGDTGDADASFDADVGGDSPSVTTFALEEDRLFIGGPFEQVGGEDREHVAAVDPGDGALDGGFETDLREELSVGALSADGGDLYVGGSDANTQEPNPVRVDAETGDLDDGFEVSPRDHRSVRDIKIRDGYLYAAGSEGLGRVDLAEGEVDDWAPKLVGTPATGEPTINALRASGDRITALGSFHGAGGARVDRLAAFDRETGALDASWNAGVAGGVVRALESAGDTLYVVGTFDAKATSFDVSDGSDADWAPAVNDNVFGLALDDDEDVVFLGGALEEVGGEDRDGLAAVDADTGDSVEPTGNPDMQRHPLSVSYVDPEGDDPKVHIGGDLGFIGEDDFFYHHAFPADDFTDGEGPLNLDSPVQALDISSADPSESLFLGGDFENVGEDEHAHFAWAPGIEFDEASPEANAAVNAVDYLHATESVLVGGAFTVFASEARNHFAALDFDGSDLTLRDSPEVDAAFDANVFALAQTEDKVAVGGDFTEVDGERHGRLVLLEAESLEPAWPGASAD